MCAASFSFVVHRILEQLQKKILLTKILGILVKIIPSKRKILDSLAATHLPKLIEAAKGLVEHPFMESEIENEDKFILKDITRRKSFQISACMDSASLYFCHFWETPENCGSVIWFN